MNDICKIKHKQKIQLIIYTIPRFPNFHTSYTVVKGQYQNGETNNNRKRTSKQKQKTVMLHIHSCRYDTLWGLCFYIVYIYIYMHVCCMTLVNNCLSQLLSKIENQLSKLYVTIG